MASSVRVFLGDPAAASREDAINSGKSLLQEKRARVEILLPNQFLKGSTSFPLIGQKKYFFLANQREVLQGDSVAILHKVVFLIDRATCRSLARTTRRFSWRVSGGGHCGVLSTATTSKISKNTAISRTKIVKHYNSSIGRVENRFLTAATTLE